MQLTISASDLLSLPELHGDDGQHNSIQGSKPHGESLDALEGLHNNILATGFSSPQRSMQQQSYRQPSLSAAELHVSMSCDVDLLNVEDLPHNPPDHQPPVPPYPAPLSSADLAGFLYAEPNHLPSMSGMSGVSQHSGPVFPAAVRNVGEAQAFLPHPNLHPHPSSLHPMLQQPVQPSHFHPPLLSTMAAGAFHPSPGVNPPLLMLPPSLRVHTTNRAQQQQHAQHCTAFPAAAASPSVVDAPQRHTPTESGSGTARSGAGHESPSFMQAALALLKQEGSGGGAGADAGGGPASAGLVQGQLPAMVPPITAGLQLQLQQYIPATGTYCPSIAAARGGAHGISLAPPSLPAAQQAAAGESGGSTAARAQRPQRSAAQQAVSILKVVGGGSDGGSLLDDEEEGLDLSDEQGATPRDGSRSGGGKGGSGGRKGSTRPRSNADYDALVDPSLPPDEARRMRRMLSNRESARRSRRRRQTHLSTLEEQVEQLKSEKEQLEVALAGKSQAMQVMEAEKQQLLLEVENLRKKLTHTHMPHTAAGEARSDGLLTLPPHPPPRPQHTSSTPCLPQSSSSHQTEGNASDTINLKQQLQADELHAAEWGKFGVALGGVISHAGHAGGGAGTGVEAGGGQGTLFRSSLDAGRKIGRPPSLQRISSLEQMTKKVKDGEQQAQQRSPPTVLEGLPDHLLNGTAFGSL